MHQLMQQYHNQMVDLPGWDITAWSRLIDCNQKEQQEHVQYHYDVHYKVEDMYRLFTCGGQCWESYSVKVIQYVYYLLLFKCNALQLHTASDKK